MEKESTPPMRPPNPAMPYREDCWSDGETSALVDAWGDRYIELNRGNLRQKQWQEVADAVNSRRGGGRRPKRTDVQCKNRIDTLKKKLKTEKNRIANGEGESQWPFFSRLDDLVGSGQPHTAKKPSASPPLAVALSFRRKGSSLPTAAAVRPAEPREKRSAAAATAVDNAFFRRAAAAAAAAAAENDDPEEEEGSGSSSRSSSRSGRGFNREKDEEGSGIRELAKAIMRFAEIYERVEESKQRQMIELERQRMEFAKALEFQKMQIIVDSQVQLARMKRAKGSDTGNFL